MQRNLNCFMTCSTTVEQSQIYRSTTITVSKPVHKEPSMADAFVRFECSPLSGRGVLACINHSPLHDSHSNPPRTRIDL